MSVNIPTERPVKGSDILFLKEEWGITVIECQQILGLTNSAWAELAKNPQKPIKNNPVAILARYYAKYPAEIPYLDNSTITERLRDLVSALRPDTWKTDISKLLGRDEKSSYYRWFVYGKNVTPPAGRLGKIILDHTSLDDPKRSEEFLKEIEGMVENEKGAYAKATGQ